MRMRSTRGPATRVPPAWLMRTNFVSTSGTSFVTCCQVLSSCGSLLSVRSDLVLGLPAGQAEPGTYWMLRYSIHLFVLVLMCYGVMVTASVSNIHRYGPFEDQNEEDQLEKNAIIYFLDLWIERCTNEFCQNLDVPKINHLMEYVKLHMPSSHLFTRVEELMTKVEEQKSMKATPKEEEVADLEPSSASASASDHQGELEPQEDAVVPEIVEPTILVAQPTPLLQAVSEEDVPTAADAQPPPDVAADAPAPGQALLPVLVTLEERDCVSSLPNINIWLERFRMTCSMVTSTICRAKMHFLFLPNLPPYVFLL